jgi:hypothetical protein
MSPDLAGRTEAERLPFSFPEPPFVASLTAGATGLLLLFIALDKPDCRNPAIDVAGVGGGMDELMAMVDEPPPALAPAAAGVAAAPAPAPAANPPTAANAAPAAVAAARTKANAVDPTSPEMIPLAINGTIAIARA